MPSPSTIVTFTDADGDEFPVRLPYPPATTVHGEAIEEKVARRLLTGFIESGDFAPTMPVTVTKVEGV